MILRLFDREPRHPLTDAKELQRIVAALPNDDPTRLIDEVSGWFESLEQIDDLRDDHLWAACHALDRASQRALRRLTRGLLTQPRRRAAVDQLVVALRDGYYGRLAALYGRVLRASQRRDKVGDALRSESPAIICRLLATLGSQYKWACFRHSAPAAGFWKSLGDAYLAAVSLGIDSRPGPAAAAAATPACTPAQEYLKTVLLAASSPDSLQPSEIELAEQLIAHLLPNFVLATSNVPGMLYWVDALLDQPPLRLATLPKASPGLRVIAPGKACETIDEMLAQVQKGFLPETLNLGTLFPQRLVGRVLRHFARYWAPQPPMREHRRHAVTTAIRIIHGFDACADLFDEYLAIPPADAAVWQADNVSLTGVGARIAQPDAEWPRVGTLLCLLPEGSDKWLIGLVRRLVRHQDGSASAGIETLAKEARVFVVRARTANGVLAPAPIRTLLITTDSATGEARLLLPGATFDPRESLEGNHLGRRLLLTPIACDESGADFDLARYRVRVAD